jgi:hypothetical protein
MRLHRAGLQSKPGKAVIDPDSPVVFEKKLRSLFVCISPAAAK